MASTNWTTPTTDYVDRVSRPSATQLNGIGGNFNALSQKGATNTHTTADTAITNSTTLTNVTGALFPIAASETYYFEFTVRYNSPAAADVNFAVTAPSGYTLITYGGLGDTMNTVASAATSDGTAVGFNGRGVNQLARISGIITNGATTGNVRLQAAQGTASTDTTTVYAYGRVQATRIS